MCVLQTHTKQKKTFHSAHILCRESSSIINTQRERERETVSDKHKTFCQTKRNCNNGLTVQQQQQLLLFFLFWLQFSLLCLMRCVFEQKQIKSERTLLLLLLWVRCWIFIKLSVRERAKSWFFFLLSNTAMMTKFFFTIIHWIDNNNNRRPF